MADDEDLETIDLREAAGRGESVGEVGRPRPGRSRPRPLVLGAVALVLVVGAGFVLARRARPGADSKRASAANDDLPSPSTAAPTASSTRPWTAPPGIVGLLAGRYVAVVDGTPILVGDGPPRRLLADIPGPAVVDATSGGSVLLGYRDTARVIVGPDFRSGVRDALPAAIAMVPDAAGRWWSNDGELQGAGDLQPVAFPRATDPVAHLADGYLLVDAAHTRLLSWRPRIPLSVIGLGRVRVLAVAGDLVAWSDDTGAVVHVVDLRTERTIDVDTGSFAITARFSPDGTRIAIRVGAEREYLMLAAVGSGDVLADVATSPRGGGLGQSATVPPALQPVAFSWVPGGELIVATMTDNDRRFLLSIDPRDGSVRDPVPAPDNLDQLIVVS